MKCQKCKKKVEELNRWWDKWLCDKCYKKEVKKYEKELEDKK